MSTNLISSGWEEFDKLSDEAIEKTYLAFANHLDAHRESLQSVVYEIYRGSKSEPDHLAQLRDLEFFKRLHFGVKAFFEAHQPKSKNPKDIDFSSYRFDHDLLGLTCEVADARRISARMRSYVATKRAIARAAGNRKPGLGEKLQRLHRDLTTYMDLEDVSVDEKGEYFVLYASLRHKCMLSVSYDKYYGKPAEVRVYEFCD